MIRNAIHDRLSTDDRGVSPVIGVILMVAITVILAAVIGTFVLDLGQSAGNSAPSASLTVTADATTDSFEINHKGGDGLSSSQTRISVTNSSTGDSATWAAANDTLLSVGGTANVSIANSEITFDGTPLYASSDQTATSLTGVASGYQYDIQVIDTESQRVIFETTVTA